MVYDDTDSNGVAAPGELIHTVTSRAYGDYNLVLHDTTLDHILVKITEQDFHPTVRFTSDTMISLDLRDLSSICTEIDFGFLGPRSACFAIADMQESDNVDELYSMNRFSGENYRIGDIVNSSGQGATAIEALCLNLGMDTLYAMNGDQLVWVDLETGTYQNIGSPLGNMNGDWNGTSNHTEDISDVDGMTYDLGRDVIWGVERKSSGNDMLFQINRKDGTLIEDAFGAGVDFVEITGTGIQDDVDDLAINNVDGKVYAINNTNNGTLSRLIKINETTGVSTVVGASGVGDVEGMGFYNDGQFYGTTGVHSTNGYRHNSLFNIDTANGQGAEIDSFTSGGNDFEACDCFTGLDVNLISGNVFFDEDSNGIFNGSDTVFPSIKIYLLRDANHNDQIDLSDVMVDSVWTNSTGDYAFIRPDTGDFLTAPRIASSPLSGLKTTTSDSITEHAEFVSFGQFDPHNDFGFSPTAGNPPIDPVPVTWLKFNAIWDANDALLTWSTASEINSREFIVQRRIDNGSFVEIGRIDAAGFSDQIQEYAFIDYQAKQKNGQNFYYRLKQMDFDNAFEYSAVRLLSKMDKGNKITVAPVPFQSELFVQLNGIRSTAYHLTLSTASGQIVRERNFKPRFPLETLQLNQLGSLANGVYFLEVEYNGKTEVIKLIK